MSFTANFIVFLGFPTVFAYSIELIDKTFRQNSVWQKVPPEKKNEINTVIKPIEAPS